MKIQIKKTWYSLLPLSVLFLPAAALAQEGAVNQGLNGATSHNGQTLASLFGTAGLNGVQDLPTLILFIINIMLFLAGLIAVGFIIIGGYQYVTSAGNEEQAEKGKKALINAIIGIVVIIMAYAIVQVITNLITTGPL